MTSAKESRKEAFEQGQAAMKNVDPFSLLPPLYDDEKDV